MCNYNDDAPIKKSFVCTLVLKYSKNVRSNRKTLSNNLVFFSSFEKNPTHSTSILHDGASKGTANL
jgi:hypothetical protein